MGSEFAEVAALKARPPEAIRAIAGALLGLEDARWSDWELDFLDQLARCHWTLSTRQAETLRDLQAQGAPVRQVGGFSVRLLAANTWAARDVFEDREDDEALAFLQRIQGAEALRPRQARFLASLARQAGLIDADMGDAA